MMIVTFVRMKKVLQVIKHIILVYQVFFYTETHPPIQPPNLDGTYGAGLTLPTNVTFYFYVKLAEQSPGMCAVRTGQWMTQRQIL